VDTFEDLFDPKHREAALACTSEMVLNSLRHAEDCLLYMAGIKQGVFNFVAIPQVMAIATLEVVFQNSQIFETNVKITRGDAVQLMMESQNLRGVCSVFKRYVRRIKKKNNPKDPNFLNISMACGKIEQFIESTNPLQDPKVLAQLAKDGVSGVLTADKAKSINGQGKSNIFYFLLAVFRTVFFILAIMVSRRPLARQYPLTLIKIGVAYWVGARFDINLEGLTKANMFSRKENGLNTRQGNVMRGPLIGHGDL
jgi:farnesyl-diphosphate farnesyltransferase